MSHDQLARVFPNGRTVHLPADGNPLPGYQLARAEIEKRGNGDDGSAKGMPNLLTALFKGRAAEDEDERAAAPAAKPSAAVVVAAAIQAKIAEVVPMPRAKPVAASSIQLASADSTMVPAARPEKPAAPAVKADGKPQTPADIINARGFWTDLPAKPKQATPAQVAAITARQALAAAAEPNSTGSLSDPFQALAYAPAPAPIERTPVVTASAPIPRGVRPTSAARNPMAVTNVTTVIAKDSRGHNLIATSTRLAAAPIRDNDVWMRAMIVAPSASASMASTVLGDFDLTSMRTYFAKPQASIAMTFCDDPHLGAVTDQFSGPALVTLTTTSFVKTAALR
jgi:hypothetical protein